MSFVSILVALLLEQARPLAQLNPTHNANRAWVRWVVVHVDAGKVQHAWLAWGLCAVFPALLACAIHWILLKAVGWFAAVVWSVAVLYVTLGFRQFSHHFTQVRDALYAGDETLARQKLASWMRVEVQDLPRNEIVRYAIEYSLICAHRHVLGVLVWYSLFAAVGMGPAGAVLYRISAYLSVWVSRPQRPESTPLSAAFNACCLNNWYVLDWLPVRMTAVGFAFVGSFEEAIDNWRRHHVRAPRDNDGVILAAAAGAINVRVGSEATTTTTGEEPQVTHLGAVVGLVWRTVVMWMVVLLLLSLARLLG